MTINKLSFDNETENFETTLLNGDKSYTLTLCDFVKEEEANAIALENTISKWLDMNINVAKKYAASKLLRLKNDSWLDEDEAPLTETKFVDTIQLESILAFSNNSFQIYFSDNDIFWGHTILIDIDKDFNFDGANIAG